MDVLSVTPYYLPEGGGLERYAHEILARLQERGHGVQAVSFTREDRPDETLDGVPVRRHTPQLVLGSSPVHAGFPGRVTSAIQATSPDVVLAHTPVPFPAEAAFLAAQREGVPFVLTYHAGRLRGSAPALELLAGLHRRTAERYMLANSDRLIAVSPFVREQVLADHRDRTALVPPGVDADRFSPDGAPEGRGVLFVGPLSSRYEWKGLDTLWRAFAQVRDRFPEAQLTLVGDGDRRERFEQQAAEMDGAVRVPGRVSDEDLVAEYRRARVVALPSTSTAESFGMVLAEANACGRPVVGSRIGGIPGFVDHGHNGLLAAPGDADELADRLATVLADDELARRMGRRGRKRVLAEHDWDRLAERTEDVLREAADPALTAT